MADNKIIKKIVLSDGTAADLDVKYWGGLETSAKQDTLISGTNIKTINGQSIIGEGNIDTIDGIQEVTYNQLNSLIKQNMLITGQQYRITDYVTTTTQENTISAGHRFDIIVTALDESTLSEKVKAIQNDNDDYFDSCNLSAWKIWYSLDNDTNRFKWADSENGKGVIYRMIDEWGNDCPYDFKNIQFKRWLYEDGGGITKKEYGDYDEYCYTFSWEDSGNGIMDASIFGNNGDLLNAVGQISGVYGNVIGVYNSYDGDESPQSTKQYLNDIVFFSTYGYESGNYYGCYSNTFGNNCYSNTFGNACHSNTFGNNCHSNEFGGACHSNTFGDGCYENVLPNNCLYNTFDTSCYGNKVINEAGTTQKYNIKKGVSEKTIIVDSTFINLEIGVDVWVTSSGELIQEPINSHITLGDIDLMWGDVFSSEGYYSGTSQDSEVINSIGIGDYDEEKEGSDEE